ncbi:MAG TPA: hypothetical protein VK934_04375 [Fimbriimonas sp.]|nr:hypothetical protein [Fimbriimonas sp.]
MGKIYSAVDIGSNTIHQLTAEVDRDSIHEIADNKEWLGLGEVVARSGEIPSALQDRVVETLLNYRSAARVAESDGWYVFATEAVRRAKNSAALLKRIRRQVGVEVEIVNGDREADLAVAGAMLDCELEGEVTLADVGGGSAQIATVKNGRATSVNSVPLGTGTLSAKFSIEGPSDPTSVRAIAKYARKTLAEDAAPKYAEALIASGGVARGIWKALHPDGDRTICLPELDYLIWAGENLSVEGLSARFQVRGKRASTLLPGAIVFREMMRIVGVESMQVSRFGVREGAILRLASGKIEPCPL